MCVTMKTVKKQGQYLCMKTVYVCDNENRKKARTISMHEDCTCVTMKTVKKQGQYLCMKTVYVCDNENCKKVYHCMYEKEKKYCSDQN